MENSNPSNDQHRTGLDKLKHDLEPGRPDRNLLVDERQEAPIDQDRPMADGQESRAADETYIDEDTGDLDYFEKRAGDNVRK